MGLTESVLRPVIVRVAHGRRFRWFATKTRPGRAVASRFVAGESLVDGMRAARELEAEGLLAMLNFLGEDVEAPEQALSSRADYLSAVQEVAGSDVAISIKPTQLGLDSSLDQCWANLVPILDAAESAGTLVTLDMESHPYVDATLELARWAHERHPGTGVALQAMLRRTDRDVFSLPEGLRIRLVKGAYLEPAQIVHKGKREVDASFARLFSTLLARGHPIDVATHDPVLIDGVRSRVDELPKGWSQVEFQMLYGVRPDLQRQLAELGYPVRVYVPYGTEWYPYLTRRLAERPANLWFFLSNLVRRSR